MDNIGRRRDERLPGAFPVECARRGSRFSGVAIDISPSGLRVRTNTLVEEGEILGLTVKGPEGACADLSAVVRWFVEFPTYLNPIFPVEAGLYAPSPSQSYLALFSREFERFLDWREAVRVPNAVRVEICGPGLWEATFALNLSKKGMFVRTNTALQPGQLVEVRLLLPRENEPISLQTEVVHVLDAARALEVGTPPGVGLRLAFVPQHLRQRYNDFCDYLETRILTT